MASANRLGARRLDLYQVHQPNPVVRDGTIMRGMRALQRVGLVGEVGVSNYSLARWRAAEHGAGQPGAEQPGPLQPGRPLARARPAAVRRGDRSRRDRLQPAGAGAAVGPVRPGHRPANRVRAGNPLFLPENLERAGDLIGTLREVADAHSATPAQIALAWVIHRPGVAAIPGASSVEQLESNVAAAEIDLTDDEYQALQAAADRFRPVTGAAALPRLVRARLGR